MHIYIKRIVHANQIYCEHTEYKLSTIICSEQQKAHNNMYFYIKNLDIFKRFSRKHALSLWME